MSDKEAIQLLELLIKYFQIYGEDPFEMNVSELAQDLLRTTPESQWPHGYKVLLTIEAGA